MPLNQATIERICNRYFPVRFSVPRPTSFRDSTVSSAARPSGPIAQRAADGLSGISGSGK